MFAAALSTLALSGSKLRSDEILHELLGLHMSHKVPQVIQKQIRRHSPRDFEEGSAGAAGVPRGSIHMGYWLGFGTDFVSFLQVIPKISQGVPERISYAEFAAAAGEPLRVVNFELDPQLPQI